MTVNQDERQKLGQITRLDHDSPEGATEKSAVEQVYHAILLRIVRGEWTGGTELKSTQLASSLGVSRTPVVQALQRLAADGIVNQEINKRAVVRQGAENWLVEIHQLRQLLEPHAAELAAGRITNEEIHRLEELAEKARPRPDADWVEAARQFDFALHLAIANHTGNLVLCETLRKCWSYKVLSYAAPERPEVLEKSYHEHLAILDALRKRDAATARAAMAYHLSSAATGQHERIV